MRARPHRHNCERLLAHDMGARARADRDADQPGGVLEGQVQQVLAGRGARRQGLRGRHRAPCVGETVSGIDM